MESQKTVRTDESNHESFISGYDAEIIRRAAERIGKTPEELVLSFFGERCNALGNPGGAASFAASSSFFGARCNAPQTVKS